ncbi:MAG: PorT family protein [Pedobacter sp.]|nr:MAG: PorT family protein [Pedobacter sp.]
MKKQFLSIVTGLSLLMTVNAYAQFSAGLSGGYNRNYLYTNVGYRAYTQYQPVDGFSLSIPIKYTINNWLAVQTEAQFIQKNYRVNRNDFLQGIYNTTMNQYLQLPIMGHFSFGGQQLKGFLNLGGYAGYWATSLNNGVTAGLSSKMVDDFKYYLDVKENIAYNESHTFDERKDRRLELGWLTGLGISYQLARYTLFIEGRYSQSFLDQQKNYMLNQIPRYNQTYMAQIGCLFLLRNPH